MAVHSVKSPALSWLFSAFGALRYTSVDPGREDADQPGHAVDRRRDRVDGDTEQVDPAAVTRFGAGLLRETDARPRSSLDVA
jgi:hypothetical protein